MSFEFTILTALCIIAITATVGRWKSQIALARSGVFSKRASVVKLSMNIRQQAKQTYLLKRMIKRGESLIEARGAETEKIINQIAALENIDDRILIVDDKRGRGESRWRVRVLHNNMSSFINPLIPRPVHNGWKDGKICLVWATDEAAALRKIGKIYSNEEGFVVAEISLVAKSPQHLGD